MAVATTGEPFAPPPVTVRVNWSETLPPFPSEAVSRTVSVTAEAGAVPLSCRVAGLKVSQEGSALPLPCVAESVSASPSGSVKVPLGTV